MTWPDIHPVTFDKYHATLFADTVDSVLDKTQIDGDDDDDDDDDDDRDARQRRW